MIQLLKFHLLRAQNRMRQLANKKRSDRSFSVGDFVFLKLQPYKQHSVARRPVHNLSPRYFGPYKVLDKVGHVAYMLDLPAGTSIHNVFHVSQLKKCVNPTPSSITPVPASYPKFQQPAEPESILERKMVKRAGQATTRVLVKWKNLPEAAATWEFYTDLIYKFPHFDPWGQGYSTGG